MGYDDRDGFIWLDGEYVPWREAKVHVLTHTLHYGVGAWEGIRAYKTDLGPAIFRLQDHTNRLFRSTHILQIPVPYNKDELNKVQKDIIKRNNLDSAYIRPLIFYGAESLGLHAENLSTHVMVAAWEWGAYLGAENLVKGVRVHTSSFNRNHVNSIFCKAKANGNYLNSIIALQEAQNNGYDEALLLDQEGFVAEGSGENIFIVRNNMLLTPDLSSVLDGITRATIIELANEIGLIVRETRLTRSEIYTADEAFFTGTAAEVTPIRELDGRTVGDGKRGPITEKLQTLYMDLVQGKSNQHPEWLTYINSSTVQDAATA